MQLVPNLKSGVSPSTLNIPQLRIQLKKPASQMLARTGHIHVLWCPVLHPQDSSWGKYPIRLEKEGTSDAK